jgi:hypothetical protein
MLNSKEITMKKILMTLLIMCFIAACDDRLEDLNKPTKQPVAVPAETLFSNGVKELAYMVTNSNTNINVFRLYAQYWAQTTYPDESQYNMVTRRNPDNFWRGAYRDALMDLEQARLRTLETWELEGLSEADRDNRLAMIAICKVYAFAALVDAFGPIPYSSALDPEILEPEYDDDQEVYSKLFEALDNALGMLDAEAAGFPGTQDLLYGGDVEGWIKFGNSLRLKLAINIADVDQTTAASQAQAAINGGVFTSNDDNASITYLGAFPNTHPVHEDLVQSGRDDYVVANTLVDRLVALSDPRLPVFAQPLSDGVTYSGGIYGTNNTFSARSHIGEAFYQPDLEGLLLDYAEVEFLLAEGKERGFAAVPGTAEEHYNAGIRASMEYWGIDEDDIDDYLAQANVAYATAAGDWKQKIGVQHWIALFNRGFEGWTVWRRLDFTGFNAPPGMTLADIPRRFIYPIEEATLNNANLKAGIEMLGGPDEAKTKIFWDVN